jgi:hypothetical protein
MLTAGFQQRTQVCHTLHGLDLQNWDNKWVLHPYARM